MHHFVVAFKKNKLILCLFLIVVFTGLYGLAPLYSGNQNTHFLFGIAKADIGTLSKDWTINTADPFPLFSILIFVTTKYFSDLFFYGYIILFYGIYVGSLIGIAHTLNKAVLSKAGVTLFVVIFFTLHSSYFASQTESILDINITSLLFDGVASHYVLGKYFQPSVFGVLFFLSIYLFLIQKRTSSFVFLLISSAIHPGLLLIGICLLLGYLFIDFIEKRKVKNVYKEYLLSFLVLISVFMYNHIIFFNTTNSYYSEVLYDILIHFRLPHHLLISNWFDSLIIPKFLIVLYALYLYRRTKIFPILFCLFIIPLVLSILQLITGNRILAYAMPWRVFMILVPLASTLVLMQIIHKLDSNVRFINSKYCVIVGVIVLGFLVYKGIDISRKSFTNYFNQPESNVVNFIRNNSSENDVYLVNEQFRSFDFENFRLLTGKPLFVDYKLHPYKKDEIVEWYNRIVFSHNFFSKGECGSIKKFATEFKVTHIVQRKTNTFSCPGLTKIYEDKNYILYIIQSV